MIKSLLLISLFIFSNVSFAKIKVVTTLPDLAEVVASVGGDKVKVTSMLEGTEDPHFLDATPSFIKKVARADIVCMIGLDLEVGWIPKVLEKSGNAKVQLGGQGHCIAGSRINALEKPNFKVDRSMGDVHPAGNPHYNLSPTSLIKVSETILAHLINEDPSLTNFFKTNQQKFSQKMMTLKSEIKQKLEKASTLSQTKNIVIEYHKEFTYFFDEYNLKSTQAIEKLPGVPPSAKRIAEVSLKAKKQGVKLAMGSYYAPEKHLKKFSEISGVAYQKLPTMVQKNKAKYDNISKVQHVLADAIIESLDL